MLMFCQSQLIVPKSAEHKNVFKGSHVLFEKTEDMREIENAGNGGVAAQNHIATGVKPNAGNELSVQTGSSVAQRYLRAGWCALLCKIKHQRIVKGDAMNQNQSALKIESVLPEARQVETIKTTQMNLSCTKAVVSVPSSSLANQWKPYLRPILPASRSNLWRRRDDFLVERNQLP